MATARQPARTEREWWALLKSSDKSFIRSKSDWKVALADPQTSPLKGCDPKAIAHFTKNLKFSKGGLGHADYSQVAEQMTYSQFRNLWGRFGLGMGLFEDHEGYRCRGPGDCAKDSGSICTSNC